MTARPTGMNDEFLFISDCHLDARRPEISTAVCQFLDKRAVAARCLFILGDLFEVWLGDDDPAQEHQPVIESLYRLSRNTDVYFIAGNRDFLLGKLFADRTGITLLEEPHSLDLNETRVVLIHGDTLCTDDHDYQAFRCTVRSRQWQAEFLARPLSERQHIAARLRNDSIDAMADKSIEIMDVNPQAVQDCFRENEATTIIHGHTHRPAVHRYDPDLFRIVLGDWGHEPSYLSWNPAQGFKLTDPRV